MTPEASTAEQFIFRARAWKAVCLAEWFDDDSQDQSAPEPLPESKHPRARKAYENGPDEGNRWDFFKSELGRFLERAPVVSEEVALNYAALIRDTMLNPRPTEQEWLEEYRPARICRRLVAREETRRESGGGPKEKRKTREECILEATAEIRDTFILARDPIDRVYFYDEEHGRYAFDDHETFLQILLRILSANDFAIGKADKEKLLMGLALGAPRFWADPPLNKVNLANGILNVEAEQLEKHTPGFLYPNQFDIDWDPTSECPNTDAFLADIAYEDEVICLFEWFGYLLVPDTSRQKALLVYGQGSNGKSQLLKLLTRLLGRRNYSAVPLAKLEGNNFAGASLVGRLANFEFDMSDSRLPGSDFFKSVVGADDAINIEKKYKDSSDVRLYTRFVMSCNRYPRSSDNSKGFWRRWIVWSLSKRDFDNCPADAQRIRDSEELVDSLAKEAPGILRKAIRTLKDVRARKAFTESPRMRAALAEFKSLTDSVAVWLSSNVIKGDPKKVFVQQKQLHGAYNDYCDEKGYSLIDAGEFSQKVLEYCPEITTDLRHGARYFCGIGLPAEGYADPPAQDYTSRRLFEERPIL